jgi:hypothetical protein
LDHTADVEQAPAGGGDVVVEDEGDVVDDVVDDVVVEVELVLVPLVPVVEVGEVIGDPGSAVVKTTST